MGRESVTIWLGAAWMLACSACDSEVSWVMPFGATSSAGGNATAGGGGAVTATGGQSPGGGGFATFTSSTTTSSTTTSSTSGTGACDHGHGSDPGSLICAKCEDCALSGPCGSDLAACTESVDCIDYTECKQSCGGCTECDTLYPEGKALYDAVIMCLYCTCESDCDGAEWCLDG